MVTNLKYHMEAFILVNKSEGTLTFFLLVNSFWPFLFPVLLLIYAQPALKVFKHLNHKQTSNEL